MKCHKCGGFYKDSSLDKNKGTLGAFSEGECIGPPRPRLVLVAMMPHCRSSFSGRFVLPTTCMSLLKLEPFLEVVNSYHSLW